MRTVTISTEPDGLTEIGNAGENSACVVLFPVTGWTDLYGEGTYTVFNQRPTEGYGYPVTVEYDSETETVKWTVSESDLAYSGKGYCQVVLTVDSTQVARSPIYRTFVAPSVGETEDVPDPVKPWFNEVIGLLGVGMTAEAVTLEPNTEATASYDKSTQVLTLGIPQGQVTKDGIVSVLGYTPADESALTAEVTRSTEADATHTADIATNATAIAKNAENLSATKRSLDALWKLNEGISYDFEEDATEAYTKTIPTGAKAASLESIGGKSVVWNQQFNLVNDASATQSGITYTRTGSSVVVNGTATANVSCKSIMTGNVNFVSGHIYFVTGCPTGGSESTYRIWIESSSAFPSGHRLYDVGGGRVGVASASETIGQASNCYVQIFSGVTVTNLEFKPRLFDLTQMFGVTSTTDVTDDMKSFCESYAADHPAYNAGEIISADVDKVVVGDTDLTIPSAIRELDGYGWSNNTLDIENKVFIRKVESQSIGSDGALVQTMYSTPVTTDITDLLTADLTEPFEVEAGGTITMHQDGTELPVPSTEQYCISLAEVN